MKAMTSRNPAAGLLVLWTLLFTLGISPHPVWCHKPDGRVVVEAEIVPGECRCERCLREHGGESRDSCAPASGATSIDPLLCRHGRLPSDTELASAREARRFEFFSAVPLPAAAPAIAEPISPRTASSPLKTPLVKPPPEFSALLRC